MTENIIELLCWYAPLAARTANENCTEEYLEVGLLTEIGEVLDLYKKSKWHGKDVTYAEWVSELGDVCWYAVMLMNTHDRAESGYRLASHWCVPSYENLSDVNPCDDYQFYCREMTQWRSWGGGKYNIEWAADILGMVWNISRCLGIEFEHVLRSNVEKLQARFPDNFVSYDKRGDLNV